MANAWYNSIIYGAAYWTGAQNSTWNTVSGSSTNWAMDRCADDRPAESHLMIPRQPHTTFIPMSFFNNNTAPLSTSLGADTTIRSLNFHGRRDRFRYNCRREYAYHWKHWTAASLPARPIR